MYSSHGILKKIVTRGGSKFICGILKRIFKLYICVWIFNVTSKYYSHNVYSAKMCTVQKCVHCENE